MADFNDPALDQEYTNVLPSIRANDDSLATMFSTGAAANTPINAVQFLSGALGLWNGSSFIVTPISIAGGGTGSGTAAGARIALSVLSSTELTAQFMRQDANGSDIDVPLDFRTNIEVPSTSEAALNADNLSSLASASTAFDNIKQAASTTITGVVEQATTVEAETGTANKFPDAAGVVAAIEANGRTPVSIWTGSDTSITDAEILSDTGFIVIAGNYYVTLSSPAAKLHIAVSDSSQAVTNYGTQLRSATETISAAYSGPSSAFSASSQLSGGGSFTSELIVEIEFSPL